jgi:hypothetical protein
VVRLDDGIEAARLDYAAGRLESARARSKAWRNAAESNRLRLLRCSMGCRPQP